MTTLVLTDDDARTLWGFLHDRLRSVQFEAARTDVRAYRHMLLTRQELIERLLAQLNPASGG
jgi:hypothetical protein